MSEKTFEEFLEERAELQRTITWELRNFMEKYACFISIERLPSCNINSFNFIEIKVEF